MMLQPVDVPHTLFNDRVVNIPDVHVLVKVVAPFLVPMIMHRPIPAAQAEVSTDSIDRVVAIAGIRRRLFPHSRALLGRRVVDLLPGPVHRLSGGHSTSKEAWKSDLVRGSAGVLHENSQNSRFHGSPNLGRSGATHACARVLTAGTVWSFHPSCTLCASCGRYCCTCHCLTHA